MTSMHATPFRAGRPRFVCRVVRQWCALFDKAAPRHLTSCASCRAYVAASHQLEHSLRRDALQASGLPASSHFEQQILRAVRVAAATPERAPAASFPNRAWAVSGWSAVASLAAIVIAVNFDALRVGQNRQPEPSTAEQTAVILETVETLSTQLMESVIPKAGGIVSTNPLQEELGLVYSDMRSALDFLALNFLPAAPPSSELPPRRG